MKTTRTIGSSPTPGARHAVKLLAFSSGMCSRCSPDRHTPHATKRLSTDPSRRSVQSTGDKARHLPMLTHKCAPCAPSVRRPQTRCLAPWPHDYRSSRCVHIRRGARRATDVSRLGRTRSISRRAWHMQTQRPPKHAVAAPSASMASAWQTAHASALILGAASSATSAPHPSTAETAVRWTVPPARASAPTDFSVDSANSPC